MEFSRQEHWSGLPFPSLRDLPDPGSELGSPTLRHILLYHLSHQGSPIRLLSFSHSVVSDSLQPHDCSPPGSSVHGIFQARIQSGLPFPPPRDLSNPGIKTAPPVSPPLQVDSLPLHHLGSHWIIRDHFWRNTNLLLIIGIENILFWSVICPLRLFMAETDIHCSVI